MLSGLLSSPLGPLQTGAPSWTFMIRAALPLKCVHLLDGTSITVPPMRHHGLYTSKKLCAKGWVTCSLTLGVWHLPLEHLAFGEPFWTIHSSEAFFMPLPLSTDLITLYNYDVVSIKLQGVWEVLFFHLKLKRRQQELAGKRPQTAEDPEDSFEETGLHPHVGSELVLQTSNTPQNILQWLRFWVTERVWWVDILFQSLDSLL